MIKKDNIEYSIEIVDNGEIINIQLKGDGIEDLWFWMPAPIDSDKTITEDAIEHLVSKHSFIKTLI